MSEYQRYEFLAIDRPLTSEEREELRSISSRADITATSFSNEYNWGDLKADPAKLVERYFDVFVYIANWGTHRLIVRLPLDALNEALLEQYCAGRFAEATPAGEWWIIDLSSGEEEPPGEWWEGMESWMASLAPLRAELLQGDTRPLYLAWLLSAQIDLDEEAIEPPVPPGLGELSAAQQSLAEFLYLDEDLLAVAAEASARMKNDTEGLASWLADIPAEEKDRLLLEVALGKGANVGATLFRRFRSHKAGTCNERQSFPRRTAGALWALAQERQEVRQEEAARRVAEARARREAEATAARERYLDALAGRAEQAWNEVEQLVLKKQPRAYDQAVSRLTDLRDLAERDGAVEQFGLRADALFARHASKPSFIRRVQEAKLRSLRSSS